MSCHCWGNHVTQNHWYISAAVYMHLSKSHPLVDLCVALWTCWSIVSPVLVYLSPQPTSPTTPNKPLAPLDWASGVTAKPDPSVVNKHIRKVVDVSRQQDFSDYTYRMQTKRVGDVTGLMCFLSGFAKSVFRNYDHDHDGYISQEDFESIAANFPFLDSFCVLDKDQWVYNTEI